MLGIHIIHTSVLQITETISIAINTQMCAVDKTWICQASLTVRPWNGMTSLSNKTPLTPEIYIIITHFTIC